MMVATMTLEHTVAAPIERVFAAITDPNLMAKWMWAGIGDPVAEVDLRVGGAYSCYAKEELGFRGIYLVIEPPTHLIFTLQWDADVGYNQDGAKVTDEAIEVLLEAVDTGTRIVYKHHGIPDVPGAVDGHRQGTRGMFRLLDRVIS